MYLCKICTRYFESRYDYDCENCDNNSRFNISTAGEKLLDDFLPPKESTKKDFEKQKRRNIDSIY